MNDVCKEIQGNSDLGGGHLAHCACVVSTPKNSLQLQVMLTVQETLYNKYKQIAEQFIVPHLTIDHIFQYLYVCVCH